VTLPQRSSELKSSSLPMPVPMGDRRGSLHAPASVVRAFDIEDLVLQGQNGW
jgi:hypothetical protein